MEINFRNELLLLIKFLIAITAEINWAGRLWGWVMEIIYRGAVKMQFISGCGWFKVQREKGK